MVRLRRFVFLPPALITFILSSSITTSAQDLPWPYNLPPHAKYYPEDEVVIKREVEAQNRLQQHAPVGVKKMSPDPGEKFFLDYWHFDPVDDGGTTYSENSSMFSFDAPFPLHAETYPRLPKLPRYLPIPFFDRSLLSKRDFECPAGSQACTSINRPNSCCEDGSTCQIIQDTGLGDVGCCPSNEICAGSLSQCPAGGYSSCPNNPGGGCCLPGYQCLDSGCILTNTVVVTITRTSISSRSTMIFTVTETSTTTVQPPQQPSSSGTVTPTSIVSHTVTSTPPPVTTSATKTSTSTRPNTLLCSSGFRSCPASLGGGCCPTNRACGRDVCPEQTSTNTFVAPGRPTSGSLSSTTMASSSSTSLSISGCPTGFYACSAVYQGGCCQTGRNCDTTSCPTTASITVVDGSTITAVAPTGSGITSVPTLLTGQCAGGWSTCAPDVGGGCCPTGYACGTACTATASGGQGNQVGKIAPNDANVTFKRANRWLVYILVLACIAMAQ